MGMLKEKKKKIFQKMSSYIYTKIYSKFNTEKELDILLFLTYIFIKQKIFFLF